MQKEKIRIAGAGLSGLTAAICLARMGHPVEVFEKNADSGQGRGSDWDAIENWTSNRDLFETLPQWGIERSFDVVCPEQIEVYAPSGECYPLSSRRPMVYLVRRGVAPGSLDQTLKEQALATEFVSFTSIPRLRMRWISGQWGLTRTAFS
jgi:2-polyprenyl-6-methoxyphenol hydroxylase-like FAD-dependent oxidoreductase